MKLTLKNKFDNQFGNGYYTGVEYSRIGGLSEIVSYFDCNSNCSNSITKFRNTPPIKPDFKNYQNGGQLYNYIFNPKTGNRVSINSNIGKNILKKY